MVWRRHRQRLLPPQRVGETVSCQHDETAIIRVVRRLAGFCVLHWDLLRDRMTCDAISLSRGFRHCLDRSVQMLTQRAGLRVPQCRGACAVHAVPALCAAR